MRRHDWVTPPVTRGGRLLRKAMEKRDLTLRELSHEVGVHYVQLHQYASQGKIPSLKNAATLKRKLNIPFEAWLKEL